jgi:integrase
VISRTISRHSGKKRDRYWLAHHVERLCTEAGVPVVCTQSLRGLHASVATEAGATSHVVASALGHSSPAVTHAHYVHGDTLGALTRQRDRDGGSGSRRARLGR